VKLQKRPWRAGKRVNIPVTEDPTVTACQGFIGCVRTGNQPIADVQVGLRSAAAVIAANVALKEKRELEIVL
jgi:hypothetical protein